MGKHLCDLKKSLKTELALFASLVDGPTHICRKCGRVANNKKWLCKPISLEKVRQSSSKSAKPATA